MKLNESLDIYLPKFLSEDSYKKLLEGINQFPENIDKRLYTNYLKDQEIIFQGDGINNMLYVDIQNLKTKKVASMIFSNTCDMSIENKRNFPSQIIYSPIISLKNYIKSLKDNGIAENKITSHINDIKKQYITQIFYLPKNNKFFDESLVFFDRILHIKNDYIERKELKTVRLFSLSDYGIYLFLVKLSIHFTRIQDKVERKSINI